MEIDLQKRVAYLEFVNDQLVTETEHLNKLLKSIGFTQGIKSIIAVAEELIHEGTEQENDS